MGLPHPAATKTPRTLVTMPPLVPPTWMRSCAAGQRQAGRHTCELATANSKQRLLFDAVCNAFMHVAPKHSAAGPCMCTPMRTIALVVGLAKLVLCRQHTQAAGLIKAQQMAASSNALQHKPATPWLWVPYLCNLLLDGVVCTAGNTQQQSALLGGRASAQA